MTFDLRDYQEQASFSVRSLLGKFKKVLLYLPTGAGKTKTAADIIKKAVNKKIKCLFLVDRDTLLKQSIKTFKDYGIKCEPIESDLSYLWITECYVAMVETFYRRFSAGWFDGIDIGFVVVDEAHMSVFEKVINFFPKAYILGMTATPVSSGKTPLNKIYNKLIIGETVSNLIEQKYLVPAIDIGQPHILELMKQAGEYTARSQVLQFSQHKIDEKMFDLWQNHAINSRTLIFNIDIEHNKTIVESFKRQGFSCEGIDAKTPKRDKIEDRFRSGETQILCNVGIHTKGSDFPEIDCVVVNHSTMSLTKWIQEIGRGSRPREGKDHFKVIDMGNNLIRHGSYNEDIDWLELFNNPQNDTKSKNKKVKLCPVCSAYITNFYIPTCAVCKTKLTPQSLITLESQMPAEIAGKDINSMTFKELQIYGKFKGYKPSWAFMYKFKRTTR